MGSGKGKTRRGQNVATSHVGNMATLEGVPVLVVLEDGMKVWRLPNGDWHNEHGPAMELADGHKEWRLNGKLHRVDGPAVEFANGDKQWRLNDQRHRVDGPAVERADGGKEWWLNDKLHRVDGPAVEEADGSQVWYVHGQLHREDGPAAVGADGTSEWWLNDKRTTEKDVDRVRYLKRMSRTKLEMQGKVTF